MIGALATLILLAATPGSRSPDFARSPYAAPVDSLIRPGETHFAHLWRWKNGNASPRWSPDSGVLVTDGDGDLSDRSVGGRENPKVPKPLGFAGSSSFLGKNAIVVSVGDGDSSGRSMATRWRDEKWSLYPKNNIYVLKFDDKGAQTDWGPLGQQAGAIECNTSPDGKTILYTACPAADAEIYAMNADGSNVRRLTEDHGYDGGACFSPDGQLICYQAYHPREETERAQYEDLLKRGLFDSSRLDIWVMHADGSERGQVTDLESTSMEPSFTPDSKRIIFSSDYQDAPGRQFDLYITKLDGGTPEKITNDPSPDCFPMFSPDGRYLAFTSGRGASEAGAQNVFIAEWK